MKRTILLVIITLASALTIGCSDTATDVVCPSPPNFYEVTYIAYQGHTALDKEILPEDEFLSFLHYTRLYYERFELEVYGSPMYLEFRNINTMVYPKVLCRDGVWVQCDLYGQASVGGVLQDLWCVN